MHLSLLRRIGLFLTDTVAPLIDTKRRLGRLVERKRSLNSPIICNLGCGTRYHPDWINIDSRGDGESVFGWDLRNGLPLPDGCCDVIYSSHTIEHFDRCDACRFLHECRRVLKSKGVIRLVAPDLEGVARSYLACLEAAQRGDSGADAKYEWAVIELLDQLVRHQSGGEMLKYWCQNDVPAERFVIERVGAEYRHIRESREESVPSGLPRTSEDVGKLRTGGEVHQWMYDRHSLGKLLTESGFENVRVCSADESAIEGFADYHLDTEPDGSVYKPDSFFIEASSP